MRETAPTVTGIKGFGLRLTQDGALLEADLDFEKMFSRPADFTDFVFSWLGDISRGGQGAEESVRNVLDGVMKIIKTVFQGSQ